MVDFWSKDLKAAKAAESSSPEGTRASQEGTKRGQDIAVTEATMADTIRKVKADARKAEADAEKAEREAKEGPAKSATEVALEAKTKGAQSRAAVVRAQMLNNIQLYKQDIKGNPATRAFGYAEQFDKPMLGGLIPAIPQFENFTKANAAILPLIRPLVAQSAKEGDSDKEMQVFMAYIPEAGDSDRTIETKYAMLDMLISGMADGKPPSEVLALGTKPRGVDEIEASIRRELSPNEVRGYRFPQETEDRIRALYDQKKLTPENYVAVVMDGAMKAGVPTDEAFVADALAQGKTTVDNMNKDVGWGGFSYDLVDKEVKENMGLLGASARGLVNLPYSALETFAETGKALTVNLPETAQFMGKVAGDIIGVTDGETIAAIGEHYANQYGTEQGFLEALAERPAEILMDASTVVGGLGAVGKVAKATELSKLLDPVRLATRVAKMPFQAGNVAAKATGEVGANVLGVTTGAGAEAVKEAVRAGKAGGEKGKAFVENMRGGGDMEDILAQAREAVGNMRKDASETYRSGMVDVAKDKTILDFQPIYDRLGKLRDRAFMGDKVKNPSAAAVYEKAKGIVDDWAAGDPAQFHTPEGMDGLKQRLGDLSNDFATDNNRRAASIATGIYGEVRDVIGKQVPGYYKVMKQYQTAAEKLADIERSLSLKTGAPVDTSIRKLQSILRNNANTNYGRRVDLGRTIEEAGADTLFQSLAGQQLNATTPRGLGAVTAGGGVMGAIPTGGTSLLALPLASPRLVGEAAYAGGRFAGGASDFAQNLASRAAPISKTLTDLASKYRLPAYGAVGAANVIEQTSQPEDVRVTAVSGYPQPSEVDDLITRYSEAAAQAPAAQAPVVDEMSIDAINASPTGVVIDKVTGREVTFDPDTGRRFYADTGEEYDSPELGMYRGGPVQAFKNGGQPKSKGYDYANAARTFGQGLTFGFGDEIEARLRTLAAKDPNAYRNEVNRIRMMQERYADANPMTAGGLEMAGMLGGSMLAPSLAGVRAVSNAGRVGRIGANAVDAIGQGALYSAGKAKPDPRVAGSSRMAAVRSEAPRSAADFAILSGVGSAGKRLANTRGGQAVIDFAARPVRYAARQIRR
jgi:hypothetical protein